MIQVSPDGLFPGELPRGSLVAGFKVRQRLGGGPTGSVYAGVHPQNGRKVAIKLVHPHLAQRLEVLREFEEQNRRLAALRHPGIIPLLETGRLANGQVYLITEFALGKPLTDVLASSGPIEPTAARPLLEALTLVVGIAHGQHVIHGDLTPDNIWTTPKESGQWPPDVRVMDFGMALLRSGDRSERRWLEEVPYYLSPEQCRGENPREASDIYALGVIFYQVLTGRLPFSSSMPGEVARMHLREHPRSASSLVPLPASLDVLLHRALAKEPEQRFQTIPQLLQALRGEPTLESIVVSADTISTSAEPMVASIASEPIQRPSLPPPPPHADLPPPPSHADLPPQPVESRSRRVEPGAITEEVPTIDTEPLTRQSTRRRWIGHWLAASLGLLLAGAAVLIGYHLLVGRFPWEANGSLPEGKLSVVSQPAGAEVSINNVAQPGRTPLVVGGLLRGQPYEVSVRLVGYEPWRQTVALGLAEEERRLAVQLSEGPPRFGSLTVTSTERADFFLDDRKVATQVTQATLADVRAGVEHELRVTAPGFKLVRQKLRVEAGKSQVLHFALEAEPPKQPAVTPKRPGRQPE